MPGRSHVYTTISDENGVVVPWAAIRIYAADGVTPYGDPIYVDPISAAQHSNPYVVAPGVVDFYLGTGARIVIGFTADESKPELKLAPIDVSVGTGSLVTAPSALTLGGNPAGTSVLRASDSATGYWFQPGLAPHDHHGTAPSTTRISPPSSVVTEEVSFSGATVVGTPTSGLPSFYFTFNQMTSRVQVWSRLENYPYSHWSGAVIPGASTDRANATVVGTDAAGLGRGVVAVGHKAFAADGTPAPFTPGGIALGTGTAADSGSVAAGRAAGGDLIGTLAAGVERQVALGTSANGTGPQAVALGAQAQAAQTGTAIGFATSAISGGLEIGQLSAAPGLISLPGSDAVVPGSLTARSASSWGAAGFYGTAPANRAAWLGDEPVSGIPALDNLIEALADLGLLAAPVPQPYGVPPDAWASDAVTYLAGVQNAASTGTAVPAPIIDIDDLDIDCPGMISGRIEVDPSEWGIPSVLISPQVTRWSTSIVSGTYSELPSGGPGAYRVALYNLPSSSAVPSAANEIGLFPLDANGTWTTHPVEVGPGYKRAFLALPNGQQLLCCQNATVAAQDAQVVITIGGSTVVTVPMRDDQTFFAWLTVPWRNAKVEAHTISTGAVLGTTVRVLPSVSGTTLALMALVFTQTSPTQYRAREILSQLAAQQTGSGSVPAASGVADHAWIGIATQIYQQATRSTEFAALGSGVQSYLESLAGSTGAVAASGAPAYTADNALAYWFLYQQGSAKAPGIASALLYSHLQPSGVFAKSMTGATPDLSSDFWASLWGSWFLHGQGLARAAVVSMRSLGAFRVRGVALRNGAAVQGYAATAGGSVMSPVCSLAAVLLRLALGYNTGTDVDSLTQWRAQGVDFPASTTATSPDPLTAAWYAFVSFGLRYPASVIGAITSTTVYPSSITSPQVSTYPGLGEYPGLGVYPYVTTYPATTPTTLFPSQFVYPGTTGGRS